MKEQLISWHEIYINLEEWYNCSIFEFPRWSIADAVCRLLEKDDSTVLEEVIQKVAQRYLQSNHGVKVFADYSRAKEWVWFEVLEKFEKKFQSYFKRYKWSIRACIRSSLDESNQSQFLTKECFKNIVHRAIKDLLNIMYIFGDNLDPDTFDEVLCNKGNDFWNIFTVVSDTYTSLAEVEYRQNSYLKESAEPQVLKMYKHILADSILDDGKVCYKALSDRIEAHFEHTFIEIVSAFNHWYYSSHLDINFLNALQEFTQNVLSDMELLQSQWVLKWEKGFLQYFQTDITQEYNMHFFCTHLFQKSKKLEPFIQQGWYGDLFIDWLTGVAKAECDNQSFAKYAINVRKRKLQAYIKDFATDLDSVFLNEVWFERWYEFKPSSRRKVFFENIVEDENRLFYRYRELLRNIEDPNSPQWIRFTHYLAESWELDTKDQKLQYLQDVEQEISQFSLWNFEHDMRSFIKKNKHLVDILVSFWWYNLEQDFISDKDKYQWVAWQRLFKKDYKPHGLKEGIVSELAKRKLIGPEKNHHVQIFMESDLNNSSSWNYAKVLERLQHWYESSIVNIGDMYLSDQDGITRYFKDMFLLYLPSLSCESSSDILNYVHEGLDICTSLLEGESTFEDNSYIQTLLSYWFDLRNKQQIDTLKEFLKYVLYCSWDIEKMMLDAQRDRSFFQKMTSDEEFVTLFGHESEDTWLLWPEKKISRVYQKVLSSYNGDLRDIWDLTRMLFVCENVVDLNHKLVDFIEYITQFDEVKQISIWDYTWNFTEKSPKKSGYRDVNLSIKLASWNIVEAQFHYREYLKFKKEGYELGKDFLSEKERRKRNIKKISREQAEKIKFLAKQDPTIKLPANFALLCEWGEFVFSDWISQTEGNILSSDVLYNLSRSLSHDKELQAILQSIESAGYDIAWGKTLAHEIFPVEK